MKLRNFLIEWLKAKELGWQSYQADSLGKEFIVLFADVLWYLEGRHDRFSKQSKPIPIAFTEFPRFNLPEQSKHQRAETANLCATDLRGYSNQLFRKLEQPWLKKQAWKEVADAVHQLACTLHDYAALLLKKRQEVATNHAKLFPVRVDSDSQELVVYQPVQQVPPKLALRYQELSRVLSTSAPIFLNDLLPSDPKERYIYLVELPLAIQNRAVRFTHSPGNNKGNTHFIWRIPDSVSQDELLSENGCVTTEI